MNRSFFILIFSGILLSQVDYNSVIQPIFDNNCISCHIHPIRSGALELDNYANVVLGNSNNGPAIIPYNADSSLLYRVLLPYPVDVPNEPICCRMPKDSPPISGTQINLIYNWINEGALSETLNLENNNFINNKIDIVKNYPNPFNPFTVLRYELHESIFVKITIYDIMGRLVKNLVSGEQSFGFKSVKWNAIDNFGQPVSAGVYLYQIEAGSFTQTKKIILVR